MDKLTEETQGLKKKTAIRNGNRSHFQNEYILTTSLRKKLANKIPALAQYFHFR